MAGIEVPLAFSEARRALQSHPAISNVGEFGHSAAEGFLLDVTVTIELPSRARAKGVTSTGVKAQEPVRFWFPPEYPIKAPRPYLRQDFPADLPHINPHKKGSHVPPCILESDVDELMHRFGFERVVDQTVQWLEDAAGGKLIRLDQGWEPTRRQKVEASTRFDAEHLQKMLPDDGSVLTVRTFHCILRKVSQFVLYEGQEHLTPIFTQKPDHKIFTGVTTAFVAIAPSVNGAQQVMDSYKPDTVTDIQSLYAKAAELGIDQPALQKTIETWLQRSAREAPGSAGWPWPGHLIFPVILAAKRPAPLVSADRRTVEFIPYMVRIPKTAHQIALHNATVHGAHHVRTLTPALLARVSGYEGANLTQGITYIGCGSVGSKLAMHLGRAGFGNATFIDDEVFQPHNSARNALSESSLFSDPAKAKKLQEAFEQLGHSSTKYVAQDVKHLLAESANPGFPSVLPSEPKLSIDATASSSVAAAAIISPHINDATGRYCRAMLYGQGNVAALMLEGAGRLPRADDLMAELFAFARRQPVFRAALSSGNADPSRVFIGDNCASFTMPMSDSMVSRGTSMMSLQLERWLQDGLPDQGALCIGTIQSPRDIGMTWLPMHVPPPAVLAPSVDTTWAVRVSYRVQQVMFEEAKRWGRRETGGALLGHIDEVSRSILVADYVPAPPDSKRKPTEFYLGKQGLEAALRQANADSLGHLRYVGTWHTHPMGGSHSDIDLNTLERLADYAAGLPMVSLVWTKSGMYCAVKRMS